MSDCKLTSKSARKKTLSSVSPASASSAAQTNSRLPARKRSRRLSGLYLAKNKCDSGQQQNTGDVKKVRFESIVLCPIQAVQSQVPLISILSERARQSLASKNQTIDDIQRFVGPITSSFKYTRSQRECYPVQRERWPDFFFRNFVLLLRDATNNTLCLEDLYEWVKLDSVMQEFLLFLSSFLDSCTIVNQNLIQACKTVIPSLYQPLKLYTNDQAAHMFVHWMQCVFQRIPFIGKMFFQPSLVDFIRRSTRWSYMRYIITTTSIINSTESYISRFTADTRLSTTESLPNTDEAVRNMYITDSLHINKKSTKKGAKLPQALNAETHNYREKKRTMNETTPKDYIRAKASLTKMYNIYQQTSTRDLRPRNKKKDKCHPNKKTTSME